ncbi:hypothetical protein Bbelb_328420 [Branchiostoma belcheri]|nr:hypothetical protein Bbelb_328420 [Branchiostoma belcheri]
MYFCVHLAIVAHQAGMVGGPAFLIWPAHIRGLRFIPALDADVRSLVSDRKYAPNVEHDVFGSCRRPVEDSSCDSLQTVGLKNKGLAFCAYSWTAYVASCGVTIEHATRNQEVPSSNPAMPPILICLEISGMRLYGTRLLPPRRPRTTFNSHSAAPGAYRLRSPLPIAARISPSSPCLHERINVTAVLSVAAEPQVLKERRPPDRHCYRLNIHAGSHVLEQVEAPETLASTRLRESAGKRPNREIACQGSWSVERTVCRSRARTFTCHRLGVKLSDLSHDTAWTGGSGIGKNVVWGSGTGGSGYAFWIKTIQNRVRTWFWIRKHGSGYDMAHWLDVLPTCALLKGQTGRVRVKHLEEHLEWEKCEWIKPYRPVSCRLHKPVVQQCHGSIVVYLSAGQVCDLTPRPAGLFAVCGRPLHGPHPVNLQICRGNETAFCGIGTSTCPSLFLVAVYASAGQDTFQYSPSRGACPPEIRCVASPGEVPPVDFKVITCRPGYPTSQRLRLRASGGGWTSLYQASGGGWTSLYQASGGGWTSLYQASGGGWTSLYQASGGGWTSLYQALGGGAPSLVAGTYLHPSLPTPCSLAYSLVRATYLRPVPAYPRVFSSLVAGTYLRPVPAYPPVFFNLVAGTYLWPLSALPVFSSL